MQGEGPLKAPSRVLLAASSHATFCAQHHAYTHPHPNVYTQRHPVSVRSSQSLPGKAAADLAREPPRWKLTLEKPRGMRTKRNPSIASFPGPRFQIPPLTCTLPPDWSRQHSWDAPHYFSGSTLFMPLPAHHAPSSCCGPFDQALIRHIVHIPSRQILHLG